MKTDLVQEEFFKIFLSLSGQDAMACDGNRPAGDYCAWPMDRLPEQIEMIKLAYQILNDENKAQRRTITSTGDFVYNCVKREKGFFQCTDKPSDGAVVIVPYQEHGERDISSPTASPKRNLPSPEVVKQRLDTCQGCPQFNREYGTCSLCGCPMKQKAQRPEPASTLCPLNKWVN